MENNVKNGVVAVVSAIMTIPKVYGAEKYISEKVVVRAKLRRFGKKIRPKNQNLEISLVIGRPNFAQRDFIKKCKKVGEPFPVKNVQLKLVK